jgi:hypothetical protein
MRAEPLVHRSLADTPCLRATPAGARLPHGCRAARARAEPRVPRVYKYKIMTHVEESHSANSEPREPLKRKVPEWALKAFKEFQEHHVYSERVMELSKAGLRLATGMPGIVTAIAHAEEISIVAKSPNKAEFEKNLADAKSQAEFAQTEIDAGFPHLHSQAVIALWGSLETVIFSVLADWVVNRPAILREVPWSTIKIAVGEYEVLDADQKAAFLVSLMDQKLNTPIISGISRFEKLLETVGLAGKFEDKKGRNLFEMQQVRNVLTHRRSIVDARFCKACPWFSMKPGNKLSITSSMYTMYSTAAVSYLTELIYRTTEFFGGSRPAVT